LTEVKACCSRKVENFLNLSLSRLDHEPTD
jgi:hypothetical protein